MKKTIPPPSEAKLIFFEQKNQALSIQNTFLEEENTRLQDELEVIFRDTIDELIFFTSVIPSKLVTIGSQENQ